MRIHKKIHVQIHTGQPGNVLGYSWLLTMLLVFLYTFFSITKFSSLNSLLMAEAIGYVNVDKDNIIAGQELYIMFRCGPYRGWISFSAFISSYLHL